MPYEVSFKKVVEPSERDLYINDCCIGGDVVSARLLPSIHQRYEDIQAEQEDWGWFIWFRKGRADLAIDIFCDDPSSGCFRIHLTSHERRFLFGSHVVDTDELEELKGLVLSLLGDWGASDIQTKRLDARFMPLE